MFATSSGGLPLVALDIEGPNGSSSIISESEDSNSTGCSRRGVLLTAPPIGGAVAAAARYCALTLVLYADEASSASRSLNRTAIAPVTVFRYLLVPIWLRLFWERVSLLSLLIDPIWDRTSSAIILRKDSGKSSRLRDLMEPSCDSCSLVDVGRLGAFVSSRALPLPFAVRGIFWLGSSSLNDDDNSS